MKINYLMRACITVAILLNTHRISSESWFSDFMVRIPAIGKYWMNDTQKKIYAYKENLKELKKIKTDNDYIASETVTEIKKLCQKLHSYESLVRLRINDILDNIDSTIEHANFEKFASDNRSTVITDRRLLNPELISEIDTCIKHNKNSKGSRKVSRIMTLNDEINNFRKTDLYKNNLVSAKKLKTIQQAINVRQEASRIMVNDPIHKLTNKYIEENKKQLSPTTLYYTNLTPVIEDFSKRNAYILYNLEQLKKEYIYLENRIATYQAIDEELPPRKTQ